MFETEEGFEIPTKDALDLVSKEVSYMHFGGGIDFLEGGLVYETLKGYYDVEIVSVKTNLNEAAEKLTTLIVSDDSPDLVDVAGFYPAFVIEDLLQPTDGLVDYENVEVMKNLKPFYDNFIYDNKHWVVTSDVYMISALYYNRQMFEENEMPTPRELYLQGKWDWDAFLEAAKQLTVDEDMDGKPERYGVLMANWQSTRFVLSTGEYFLKKNEKGELESNLSSTGLNRAYSFLYDLVYKHKVANPNRDIGYTHAAFDVGKAAMIMTAGWMGTNHRYFKNLKEQDILEWVPYPRDPEKDTLYTAGSAINRFVPKGAKHLDAIKAFNYASAVAYLESRMPGSKSYEINKLKTQNAMPLVTDKVFEYFVELTKEYNTTDFVADDFQTILDLDRIFRMMEGEGSETHQSYQQVISQIEPEVNEQLSIFNK